MRNKLLLGAAAIALIAPAAMAQETTSIIRGTVTAMGQPVSGASVTVTNTANGAKSQATTASDGRFSFPGLQPGGPFTVEVTSPQGNKTVTDIFTVIQQPFEVPIDLSTNENAAAASTDASPAATATTGDIVVTASRIARAGVRSTGPQTVLDQVAISKVASVNRDIRALERRDPLAQFDPSNGTYGAVSFAGVNPRFNRFTINGVTVGDQFGLNADASPTGRGPVPYDAIASFSTSFAPYDIRQTGFTGGAIDVTLLSGSNDYHVNGFYSQSKDSLQGRRIGSNILTVPKYNSVTYGATLSGPIIRDKLFFMVSGERNTDPRPFSPSSVSGVPGLTDATLALVTGPAQSLYGYDPGTVLALTQNKDEKVVGQINWNVIDGQRLSLTYINAYDQNDSLQNTSVTNPASPSLGLSSNAYRTSETLHAGIAQLNSDWTSNLSTEARFIYKTYKRGQDPELGRGFSQFRVCTDATSVGSITACSTGTTGMPIGSPTIAYGPDISRQTNTLSTKTYQGSFLTRLRLGTHDLKLLAEFTRNSTVNNFLQYSAGGYYFDSLANYNNKNADQLILGQAVNGQPDGAQAKFAYDQWAFGIQDDWQVTDRLLVTYGVRETLFASVDAPVANPFFQSRYGFPNSKTYKGLTEFEPRIGFNYRATDRLRFRGGFGIFAGGNPDIYLSNSFSNTVLSNRVTFTRSPTAAAGCTVSAGTATAAVCAAALNGINGSVVNPVASAFVTSNTSTLSNSTTNALAPNFQLPSSYKATLSADYKVRGLTIGADYIFTKVREAIIFSDARSVVVGTLPDGRPRYAEQPIPGGTSNFADTNADIILGDTTRGRSHIGVVRANYDFPFGLSIGGSYTRQDVKDVSPATSSVALSNYASQASTDPNFPSYGTSSDESKWRVTYSVGFDHAFFRDYRTVLQLFGDTRAGRPYSFTMQDNTGTRSSVFGTLGNNDRYLLYVPASTTDPIVSYDSAATQANLDGLINSTDLKKYRGRIVPKNTQFNRPFTRIDLHVEQEIPTFIGKSRFTLFGDIENLPNLLNHNWGGLRQLGFPYTGSVVNVTCLAFATPTGASATGVVANNTSQPCAQYRYSSYRLPNTAAVNLSNSLYLIRVGARFKF